MVQIYHAVFTSLLDDASREVEKHRPASCEGSKHTREPARRRAPTSQHAPSEKTAGGALATPSSLPGGASAGAHAIEQTATPRA